MKKGLFFDLDGTLWNALNPLTKSWNKAMIENKLPYVFNIKKMKSYMGLTPEETVPLAFPDVDIKTGLKYFKLALNSEINYLRKYPGKLYKDEESVLKKLSKKYDLFIISNADKGYVENYLCSTKMGKYFKGHFNQGDTGFPKWKNILLMKKNKKIDEVIYIGDTNKDKIESEKAKVKFIHAAYGFGKIENYPYKIENLKQLDAMVKKVFKI